MKRKVAALAEFAPDLFAIREAVRGVGVTPEGSIPLELEPVPGWPPTVRLPGLTRSHPLDPIGLVQGRLRQEAGLDADELIVMSRYGIPTGQRGRATILLAPRVRIEPARPDFLPVVPLPEVMAWLAARRSEGA